MQDELLEELKRRYDFDEWRGRNTLDENLFVWKFYPGEGELPGLRAHRVQAFSAPGFPPAVQSLWGEGADPDSGALVRADVFECDSRLAAHEFLLRALAQFQSPLVERRADTLGDVSFSFPGETAVLMARANLCVLLRNAGREVKPLRELAAGFDDSLSAGPEKERERAAQLAQKFGLLESVPSPAGGKGIDLLAATGLFELESVAAAEPSPEQPWYKFFSRSGEVRAENGRLVYLPTAEGLHAVTVVAIAPGRRRTRGPELRPRAF